MYYILWFIRNRNQRCLILPNVLTRFVKLWNKAKSAIEKKRTGCFLPLSSFVMRGTKEERGFKDEVLDTLLYWLVNEPAFRPLPHRGASAAQTQWSTFPPAHNAGMQRPAVCWGNRPTLRPSARRGAARGRGWRGTLRARICGRRRMDGWMHGERRGKFWGKGMYWVEKKEMAIKERGRKI